MIRIVNIDFSGVFHNIYAVFTLYFLDFCDAFWYNLPMKKTSLANTNPYLKGQNREALAARSTISSCML